MTKEELLNKLKELNRISSKLELSSTERKEVFESISGYTERFISTLDSSRAFSQKPAGRLAVTGDRMPLAEILDIYQKEVAENGINAASGKHLGYIPGGGIFAGAIADFIAAVTNPFAGVYYASPGAASIENEVVNWLKSVFSFPAGSVGCLSSGGSVSTLIAFTAARDKHRVKNEAVRKSVVYLGEQVHHSTQKALRIIGLEDVLIRYVPLDDQHRMRADVLATQIEKDCNRGLNPFLVVATAGTTDTGAVDPLNDIADIAEQSRLWFHVDAAYGGFYILTSRNQLFNGIERADSLITDPHKGLFLPYGVGAVLIKDKASALQSNYYEANYMQDAAAEELILSPANLSPELTRHFRGLRVWLPLLLHGIEPFKSCLEEKLLLTKYFRIRLAELGFNMGPEPHLSVSYFWYPFEQDTDQKNRQLMDAIHHDGEVFLSSSVINNRFAIRVAINSFRTKKETVDRSIEMIERCVKDIK